MTYWRVVSKSGHVSGRKGLKKSENQKKGIIQGVHTFGPRAAVCDTGDGAQNTPFSSKSAVQGGCILNMGRHGLGSRWGKNERAVGLRSEA